MITGQLFMSADPNVINQLVYDNHVKILVLSDMAQDLTSKSPNMIPATILLPPYQSVMAELDGNIEMAAIEYINHLRQKESDMFICAVLTALLKGVNIVIYPGKDEANMPFINTLIQFIANEYGITVGTDRNPFMYNQAYDAILYSKLYMYDLITYQDFFVLYPEPVKIPEYVIPKLAIEMNPYVQSPTKEEYERYFEDFKKRVKAHNNKFLINPITRG